MTMDFIKNRLFAKKSGQRHLVALLLTFFELALFYLVMAALTQDESWLHDIRWEVTRGYGEEVFLGLLGVVFGAAALMGGFLRRCGESWIIRFFQRFFYSVLGVIPIVNLLVPLIYQRSRKKKGLGEFVIDGSFRNSLKAETYRALVTNNIVLHPDGKVKLGLIRFVVVAVFQLLGGVFLLLLALLMPVITPLGVMTGVALTAVLAEMSVEAAYWAGVACAALVVLINVIHPIIALLIHRGSGKPAPAAVQSAPVQETTRQPQHASMPDLEVGSVDDDVDDEPDDTWDDDSDDVDDEPVETPVEMPVEAPVDSAVVPADDGPASDMEEAMPRYGEWDGETAVAEDSRGRDIPNRKEKEL